MFTLKKAESLDDIDGEETWSQLGYDVKNFTTPAQKVSLLSNFLKSEEELAYKAPEPAKTEDKENVPVNDASEKKVAKTEEVDESKMTPEEREALAKKREDEAIEAIIDKARIQKQMSHLYLESDVFDIY